MGEPAREVVETAAFVAAKQALHDAFPVLAGSTWLDEALSGVAWVLARDPTLGERVPDTDLWAIGILRRKPFPNGLLLYYRFDSAAVALCSVREASNPDPEEAGGRWL